MPGNVIVGIDEVGRGAWAGPMVVGAVVLGGEPIDGLTDSKKLTKRARVRLAGEIQQKAAGIGLGWVSARTIDEIGLSAALKLAAQRAVAGVTCGYDEIIIDGTIRLVEGENITLLKKADLLIPAVSAASIVAKVTRDAYMARLDRIFEGYGFAGHVGYGTAAHAKALHEKGVLPIHRKSFAPVAALLKDAPELPRPLPKKAGALAEDVTAEYLERLGHMIVDRNWKTTRCEIDIVSAFNSTLYFTEVKYRRQGNQGGGIAAVTARKLAQMRYASDVYVSFHTPLVNMTRKLSAVSVTGEPPIVDMYIESVE